MMSFYSKLNHIHATIKQNRWMGYFAVFNRVTLAIGFIIAGMVKIMGERFASGLSVNHPMGHYLEALYHTGYYYPFIGVVQVLAAVLLLLPRTATLGAVLYFPVILNIFVLSYAVRFDGSLVSSALMVLANLYLLCWDYDRIKYILPFKRSVFQPDALPPKVIDSKFPTLFFAGVLAGVITLGVVVSNMYDLMPHNTITDCQRQCKHSKNPSACVIFCSGIHEKGEPLDKALDDYQRAIEIAAEKK